MRRNKDFYKNLLIREKSQLTQELKELTDDEYASIKDSTHELSSYDNHPVDMGTNTLDREVDAGLRDNTITLLKMVEDALEKIDHGEYGMCQRCGNEIKEERLEVVPYSNLCEECKQNEENLQGGKGRPKEEDVMYPPFGRGFNDETDQIEYDAEDTWQDVAQYGTSNTPQDEPEATAEPGAEAYTDPDEVIGSVGIEDAIYDEEVDDIEEASKGKTSFTGKQGYDER